MRKILFALCLAIFGCAAPRESIYLGFSQSLNQANRSTYQLDHVLMTGIGRCDQLAYAPRMIDGLTPPLDRSHEYVSCLTKSENDGLTIFVASRYSRPDGAHQVESVGLYKDGAWTWCHVRDNDGCVAQNQPLFNRAEELFPIGEAHFELAENKLYVNGHVNIRDLRPWHEIR